jgi:hypothetical protein
MKEETMHFESVCIVKKGRKRIGRRKGKDIRGYDWDRGRGGQQQ